MFRKSSFKIKIESSDEFEVELELSEDDVEEILDCIEVEF